MKYFYKILIVLVTLIPQVILAVSLDIKINNNDIKVGDEILIALEIDTLGKSYNAISGQLLVENSFEIKNINIGESLISFWIENPTKTKNNTIDFSGIIPGGLNGSGNIFEITLLVKNTNLGQLTLRSVSIFENDGLGTEKKIPDKSININPRNLIAGEENTKILKTDTTKPDPFTVTLLSEKNLLNGKYVLIFNTKDRESGVKMYTALEGKNIFENVESPYVLQNQKINERIYVKAIDYFGNERISEVNIPNKICMKIKCFDQRFLIAFIVIMLIILSVVWINQNKKIRFLKKS